MKNIYLTFIALLFYTISFAQEWQHHYSTAFVTSIAENGDELWVGTRGGGIVIYNRLTGERSMIDTHNSALPSNNIESIVVNAVAQNIWIGTYDQGIAKLSGNDWTFHNTDNTAALHSDSIYYMQQDQWGKYWMATTDGLTTFDGETWQHIGGFQGDQRVWSFDIDTAGHAWIFSNTLHHYDGETLTSFEDEINLDGFEFGYVYVNQNSNKIWLATQLGVSAYDGEEWEHFTPTNSALPLNDISSMCIDSLNRVWVSYADSGIYRFDGFFWSKYTANPALNGVTITKMHANKSNTIFTASPTTGLHQLNNNIDWTNYPIHPNSLQDNYIRDIAEHNGVYYLANGEAVSVFDGETWSLLALPFKNALPLMPDADAYNAVLDNQIEAIEVDIEGNVWIASRGKGLCKYDGSNYLLFTEPLENKYIQALKTTEDNVLWIGTSDGLIRHQGSYWNAYTSDNSALATADIASIEADTQGNIWVGTYYQISETGITWGGMTHFDGTNWTNANAAYTHIPDTPTDMTLFQNHLWVGATEHSNSELLTGGLYRFDGIDNCTIFELPLAYNNSVMSLGNTANYLWVGTASGLLSFDETNWQTYTPANSGLTHQHIRQLFTDFQNNLWIGTVNGLTIYHEEAIILSNETPKVTTNLAFTVYPNPTQQFFTIHFEQILTSAAQLNLYNTLGQVVQTWQVEPLQNKVTLDVKTAAKGLYYLQLESGDSQEVLPLLIR